MEKVKISKDGSSIDFVQSETLANPKKFRSSIEVESFYRFVHDNDLRKEALEIIERIIAKRKAEKAAVKAATRLAAKAKNQLAAISTAAAIPVAVTPVKAVQPAKVAAKKVLKKVTQKAKPAAKAKIKSKKRK